MTVTVGDSPSPPRMLVGCVIANQALCREHFRLTLRTEAIENALPGQFVHLGPPSADAGDDVSRKGTSFAPIPLLRRAFSIAGMRLVEGDRCDIDVIYRVVGTATTWMASLRPDDAASMLVPLGNAFPVSKGKKYAWLVGGGVGLPPLLWLSEALNRSSRSVTAIIGARNRDLLALTFDESVEIPVDGYSASRVSAEFAANDTPVILSSDDGSVGFRGHAAAALETYYSRAGVAAGDLVVYTCGPELLMRAVARFCLDRSIECHVCMERAMACGTGTCQSCVVAVHEAGSPDGWRYELCCTQGPVFEAGRIVWPDSGGGVQH